MESSYLRTGDTISQKYYSRDTNSLAFLRRSYFQVLYASLFSNALSHAFPVAASLPPSVGAAPVWMIQACIMLQLITP